MVTTSINITECCRYRYKFAIANTLAYKYITNVIIPQFKFSYDRSG